MQVDLEDDGWNWVFLLYIGRKELRLSEQEFWDTTPCKFYALLECALELKNPKGTKKSQQSEMTYIDKIKGW